MLYLRRIPASVQLQLQNVWRGVPPLSHTCAHLAHSRYDLSAPHLTHQLYFFCTSFLPTFFVPSTYRASTDDEIHHHHPRWDSQFGMIIYRLLQLCVCISSLYTTPQFAYTCPLNKGHTHTARGDETGHRMGFVQVQCYYLNIILRHAPILSHLSRIHLQARSWCLQPRDTAPYTTWVAWLQDPGRATTTPISGWKGETKSFDKFKL